VLRAQGYAPVVASIRIYFSNFVFVTRMHWLSGLAIRWPALHLALAQLATAPRRRTSGAVQLRQTKAVPKRPSPLPPPPCGGLRGPPGAPRFPRRPASNAERSTSPLM
jgi:hypothetical protein